MNQNKDGVTRQKDVDPTRILECAHLTLFVLESSIQKRSLKTFCERIFDNCKVSRGPGWEKSGNICFRSWIFLFPYYKFSVPAKFPKVWVRHKSCWDAHFISWTLEVLRLRMLELEVVPEHGLISDVVEFILGETIWVWKCSSNFIYFSDFIYYTWNGKFGFTWLLISEQRLDTFLYQSKPLLVQTWNWFFTFLFFRNALQPSSGYHPIPCRER